MNKVDLNVPEQRPFVCSCGKSYKHRKSLWTHKNFQCETKNKMQFKCPYCERKFNLRCNLKAHVLRLHPEVCI